MIAELHVCVFSQQVEKASEFAVSEVFPQKKLHSGTRSLAVPLQSSEQLRDHDEAYSEGRSAYKQIIDSIEIPLILSLLASTAGGWIMIDGLCFSFFFCSSGSFK